MCQINQLTVLIMRLPKGAIAAMKRQSPKLGILAALKGVVLATVLVSPSYATWYQATVFQVVPRTSSGNVLVQLKPGPNETRFTGTVRGILPGSEAGASKLLAVLLTATALKSPVTIEMASVPSWNPPQVITGVGLVAP